MSRKEPVADDGARTGDASGSGAPPQQSDPTPSCWQDEAVGELASALSRRRHYREVTLALRSGLRDAKADFSFLRIRGLRSLLDFLRSVALSDESLLLFRHSQSIPEFQVIPVLFKNTLREPKQNPVENLDHIFGVQSVKITSPATDSEIALALRVLEGCCLLNNWCAASACKHEAVKILVNILANKGQLERGACLDALISLMLDSSENQMAFEECHGLEKVADLILDEQVDEHIRLKCGEFLLLLIGHVNGRENSPLASIHEDVKRLFGERCASLIWAASQFGSTLDAEQRQTALQIQARRVVEALELQ